MKCSSCYLCNVTRAANDIHCKVKSNLNYHHHATAEKAADSEAGISRTRYYANVRSMDCDLQLDSEALTRRHGPAGPPAPAAQEL